MWERDKQIEREKVEWKRENVWERESEKKIAIENREREK